MDNFFNADNKKKISLLVRAPDVNMSILKRLGKPKFWISNQDFFETMEKIYARASSSAIAHFQRQTSASEKQK